MISELYEALVDAGASEKKAKEAAEVLSTENLSTKGDLVAVKEELAGRISELGEKLGVRIAKLERDTAVMKWMIGATLTGIAFLVGGVASILIEVFPLA